MLVVRKAQEKDIDEIASLHVKAFKDFFLSELGVNFLKTYYKAVLKSCDGLLLVVEKDKEIYGFCAASKKSQGFNKHLVKENLISFGLQGIRLLLVRPTALLRLLRNFDKRDSNHEDKGDYAELYSIAVIPKAQGSGAGKLLLQQLELEIKESGIKELSLTTDYCNNDNVIGFYKSTGYDIMYEFITYPQRKMYRMIKTLK